MPTPTSPQTENGEVILKPTVGEEFSGGPALPGRLDERRRGTARRQPSTVAGGSLAVDGAAPAPTHTYGPGRSLEFVANFGGAHLPARRASGSIYNNGPNWAMFSIKGDGTFNARTNDAGAA